MNRKHFLLALGLFLVAALFMLWLISMAQPTLDQSPAAPVSVPPQPVQPAPVPIAPAGATAPGNHPVAQGTAQLQPETRPLPRPENISMPDVQPAASHTWHPAASAPLGALVLLAAVVLCWQAAAHITSSSLAGRGA